MATKGHVCTNGELMVRVVAIESGFSAFKDLMGERDARYAQRSESQDEAVAAAQFTSEKAITKAESATEKRLEGLNELRAMAADQSKNYARSDEVGLIIKGLDERVRALTNTVDLYTTAQLARGGGMKELWGYIVGAAGLFLFAASLYLHH